MTAGSFLVLSDLAGLFLWGCEATSRVLEVLAVSGWRLALQGRERLRLRLHSYGGRAICDADIAQGMAWIMRRRRHSVVAVPKRHLLLPRLIPDAGLSEVHDSEDGDADAGREGRGRATAASVPEIANPTPRGKEGAEW